MKGVSRCMYQEEDYLNLSGIQHFVFCRRQWALIHIEQQWEENVRTVEGQLLHERVHDGFSVSSRKGWIISRGMPVFSRALGANGVCDVVEFRPSAQGISLAGQVGSYSPSPVEYKRGKPKEDKADVMQLAAQAICLEEMLLCEVQEAYIYYGETRRRLPVAITEELRESVRVAFSEMHDYYARQYTPRVKPSPKCKSCSLLNLCLPQMEKRSSVEAYIKRHIREEDGG